MIKINSNIYVTIIIFVLLWMVHLYVKINDIELNVKQEKYCSEYWKNSYDKCNMEKTKLIGFICKKIECR
jgi:hypothetical protein